MWIFIIVLIVVVALVLLGVVVRDISREVSGMDEANRGGAEDAEGDAKNQQRAMADRKITREIENWRDGK